MSRLQRIAWILSISFGLLPGIAGCVVYETAPGVYSPAPPATSFDRSYDAVVGAFADQNLTIIQNDRAAGTVSGRVGETMASATVLRQADGSVRVEINVGGNVEANPGLKDRIISSYNRRMGR